MKQKRVHLLLVQPVNCTLFPFRRSFCAFHYPRVTGLHLRFHLFLLKAPHSSSNTDRLDALREEPYARPSLLSPMTNKEDYANGRRGIKEIFHCWFMSYGGEGEAGNGSFIRAVTCEAKRWMADVWIIKCDVGKAHASFDFLGKSDAASSNKARIPRKIICEHIYRASNLACGIFFWLWCFFFKF